jgi:hypothetical protein
MGITGVRLEKSAQGIRQDSVVFDLFPLDKGGSIRIAFSCPA